jgi:o-succinylbenzoate synthase
MEEESEQIRPIGVVDKISFFKEQFRELTFKFWNLVFYRQARTSRNILREHQVCYVFLKNELGQIVARGEVAPIIGLSSENWSQINEALYEWENGDFSRACHWPSSVHAAIDMLWQDLFPNEIPKNLLINGLVWMNDVESMYNEALAKFNQSFRCIKLKVGALNFEEELNLIRLLRNQFGSDITLRLDANGAWKAEEAIIKMEALSKWNIHSIEQPIEARQWHEMSSLCKNSPIPIALDEELIGVGVDSMKDLLNEIEPQFLVIKPSLHGGLETSTKWIQASEQKGIQWWATSALESNVGLSHIYRWLGQFSNPLPQGLGTGHLYTNNWDSPLHLIGEYMHWNKNIAWREPWN